MGVTETLCQMITRLTFADLPTTVSGGYNHIYGSSSDVWGVSLSEAIVEATNFGVAVWGEKTTKGGGDVTIYLYEIRMTVHYTSAFSGHPHFYVLGVRK